MIPDKLFKSLGHNHVGYEHFLNGQTLSPGYKPDFVLKKENKFIILESENGSSRKTFVGVLIKAAFFLRGGNEGELVFVIVPKKNTTASAIARHLKPYLEWIADKTNLKDVYVIEANHYYRGKVLPLDGANFSKKAKKV